MKHVKNFERRNFKNYDKYNKFLKLKFNAKSVKVYEEFGKTFIEFEYDYSYSLDKDVFIKFINFFNYTEFKVHNGGNNGLLVVLVDNVGDSFFEELELELVSNKYNL